MTDLLITALQANDYRTVRSDTPVERCPVEWPNRYGNRLGHCSCSLLPGHEGDHVCGSSRPCTWNVEHW